MWQFLIALLEDPANCAAITWTGRGMEFKLIEPEEVSSEVQTSQRSFRDKYLDKSHHQTQIKDGSIL